MYEKRALRVQKWTVEKKKVAQVFGNPLWTIACYLLQIFSLTFFYIAENMPIGVGKVLWSTCNNKVSC